MTDVLHWVRSRRERACQAVQEAHGLRLRFGAEAEDWCDAAMAALGHDPQKARFLRLVRRALRRMPPVSDLKTVPTRALGGVQ